uniref:Chlorophyll a-b binding protein, chloroplastic n=1 Tax=Haptolina brevifila TaxID=156173 RepID=A0A6U7LU07_9EUKA|mmetsp:Transcript_76021/g.150615  ORF Transcript_76021/g.150615 Transcript_76021/m.150615 type:complete len:201 (+) Transcript_76021:3-605(+)
MAAFVGFTVQSLGVHFPWNLTPTTSFADIAAAGGPADQWDALPSAAKVQILLFIGFLEMVSESSVFLKMDGTKHYIRGGKPGYFPTISDKMPHPVPLNYFDPFGLTKKMTPERKEQGLLAEINNGRWAMIGIIGCMSVSKGLFVPGLDSLPIKPYGGEIMAPFSSVNSDLPFVSEMLAARAAQIAREAAILGDAYLNNGA